MGYTYYEGKSESGGLKNALNLIARVLISSIFLMTGFGQVIYWPEMEHLPLAKHASDGILIAGLVLQIIGGLLLVLGYKARFGACVLIIYLLPATLFYHHFWDIDNTLLLIDQLQLFLKNVAIIGGLFFVVLSGAGSLSIDAAIKNKSLR